MVKICKRCHEEYNSKNKLYCSVACFRFREVTGHCKICKKNLYRFNQVYCGPICRDVLWNR